MREIWKLSFFTLLFVLCAGADPASAQDKCNTLKRATQLDIRLDKAGRPTIPVTMMGKQKYLLIDTGGFLSTIKRATVRELGLRMKQDKLKMLDVSGKISDYSTRIPRMTIGGLQANHLEMIVDPIDDGEISDTELVGALGPEILKSYDADFDFAASKFNLFDQDHCKGKVVYWNTTPAAVAIIPFRLDWAYRITFPVLVDGKRLIAALDTGASHTVMNFFVARRFFSLDENSPDVERVGQLEGESYTSATYRRRFNKIEIEGLSIANPMIELIPDMIAPHASAEPRTRHIIQSDNKPGLPDLILGMSVLSKLHLYIAYKERRLYITQATPPSPPAP